MTFFVLGACVAFATYGAVNLAVSCGLGIAWPLVGRRLEALPARPRARWLLALRLSPVLLGALASAIVALPSFLNIVPLINVLPPEMSARYAHAPPAVSSSPPCCVLPPPLRSALGVPS